MSRVPARADGTTAMRRTAAWPPNGNAALPLQALPCRLAWCESPPMHPSHTPHRPYPRVRSVSR